MKNPFKRQPIKIAPVELFHAGLQVTHTVIHQPRPKPHQLVLSIVNMNGERWHLNPISLIGQPYISLNVPLRHLSGRIEDSPIQVKIEGELYYRD